MSEILTNISNCFAWIVDCNFSMLLANMWTHRTWTKAIHFARGIWWNWNREGGGGKGGMNFLFEAGRWGDGTICKECGRGAGLVQWGEEGKEGGKMGTSHPEWHFYSLVGVCKVRKVENWTFTLNSSLNRTSEKFGKTECCMHKGLQATELEVVGYNFNIFLVWIKVLDDGLNYRLHTSHITSCIRDVRVDFLSDQKCMFILIVSVFCDFNFGFRPQ